MAFQNGAWSCLEEADRAECPISNGKHHASGSKAHETWCAADDCQVRRRRTSAIEKYLEIIKFLFEARSQLVQGPSCEPLRGSCKVFLIEIGSSNR